MDAMLLDKITDAELASLECPTYESQENAWQIVLDSLSHDNIDTLVKLRTHNAYSLANFELYSQTCGVINKIFILKISTCTDDEDSVAYLNRWDHSIKHLDVIDDYNSERKEIRRRNGSKYRFSYGDYVIKSLIGSIDPQLDKTDEKSKDCVIS